MLLMKRASRPQTLEIYNKNVQKRMFNKKKPWKQLINCLQAAFQVKREK